MDVNNITVSLVKKVINIIVFIAIVILLVQGGRRAFSFGRAIFLDEPMTSEEESREVTITIEPGESALSIGKMLERRGLIEDAYVFLAQSYCYEAGRKMTAGNYDLTTDMSAEDMMNAIVTQSSSNQKSSGE